MKLRILSTARLSIPLASALAALLAAPSASAVDFWWDGGTANWSLASAWSTVAGAATPDPASAPNSVTTADVFFNRTGVNTTNSISQANSNRAVHSMTFDTTGTTIFNAGGASTVTVDLTIGVGGITKNANSGAVTIGGTASSTGVITTILSGAQTWANNGTGALTVVGPVTNGANLLTIDGTAATTFSGVIGNGVGGVTKNGASTLRFNGANTFTGAVTVNAGTLDIGNYSALANTSGITIAGGTATMRALVVGTGATTDSYAQNLSLHGSLLTGGGTSANTLALTWTGDITLAGASTINNHGNGSIDVDGQVDLGAQALTFKTDRAGSRIDGNIIGAGGSLIKTGTNLLTISGTNSYSGTTSVDVGTLVTTKAAALPGYNSAGLVIFNGGTIGAQVGGAGWTTGEVDVLLVNATKTAGALGIDTTNGSLTQWTIFSTTNLGPALGLTKLGANTLTLDQLNTYTSPTTISAGTLRLENTLTLQNSPITVASGGTLQLAADIASTFSSAGFTLTGGTVSSDLINAGAGITQDLGNVAVSNATQSFTSGANVTAGTTASIQIANITNSSGADGSATLNPTTGNLIITGGYTSSVNAGTNGLILGGTSSGNSIAGTIENGTQITQNVTKSGNSIWTLSGTNTYNGTTTATGGALITTKSAALPGFNAAGLVIFNGGTIGAQVEVGMSGGWTTAEVDTLLTNATKTAGALGIDTTNGNLTQWTPFTTTNLGPALGLTKLGANTLTLDQATNDYVGATTIGQGTLKLDVDHTLAGALTFGFANDIASPTGTLDLATTNVNATFGGLIARTSSATANSITIGSGKTLTITGSTVNSAVSVGSAALGAQAKLNVTGLGTLTVNDATRDFVVANTTANGATTGAAASAQLDLSGLATFNATITDVYVGRPTLSTGLPSNNSGRSDNDVLTLAGTNTITASGVIAVGGSVNSTGATAPARLLLGTTNTINAASFVLGSARMLGKVAFNTGLTTPTTTIRGAGGDPTRTNIFLGDQANTLSISNTTGGSSTSLGTMDFTGGTVDAKIDNLVVGLGGASFSASRPQGNGNFKMDGASSAVDINTLVIAQTLANDSGANAGLTSNSSFTVTNGSLQVNTAMTLGNDIDNNAAGGALGLTAAFNVAGGTATIGALATPINMTLGNHIAAGNTGLATANVSVTGGTLNVFGNIQEGTLGAGTITSSLSLNGATATLDMKGNSIGTVGATIDTLTFASGTLSNVASINGTGGLTKTTAGALTVSGAFTYSGDTAVSEGILTISSAAAPANANPNNDASTVTIATTGATLDLTYSGTDIVDKLFIGGVQQAAGVYGPSATPLSQITGTGTLTVLSSPPAGYSAWATLNGASPTNLSEDHDNDGVDNGTEYFIGGPTGLTTGFTPLPGVTNTAGVISVTWTKAANYTGTYGTDFSVETSATLTGVWATEPSPGTVTISGTNVTYTFPPGTINFARLKVTGP